MRQIPRMLAYMLALLLGVSGQVGRDIVIEFLKIDANGDYLVG